MAGFASALGSMTGLWQKGIGRFNIHGMPARNAGLTRAGQIVAFGVANEGYQGSKRTNRNRRSV